MPKKKPLSNEAFLRHVRDYLPMDASVWNTNERGTAGSSAIFSGMIEHHFYRFDADSVLAVSHAIEELALEEASGSLLATIQEFQYFKPHRERYWQLAATLDRVRVIARGKAPPRHGHLRFIGVREPTLPPFWSVIYEGRRHQIMLVCRENGRERAFDRKAFDGFYTFDARLIANIRGDIERLLRHPAGAMTEFERLRSIDRAAKHLHVRFDLEQKAVETALDRLRASGNTYRPKHFQADLKKSFGRLSRLARSLPALVGGDGRSTATPSK